MSLKVTVLVSVQYMDDSPLVQIMRCDTAINPNEADIPATVLLTTATAKRLIEETHDDVIERMREVSIALENHLRIQQGDG